MVNKEIIRSKIAGINRSLARLRGKGVESAKQLRVDIDLQDIILHNLQLALQGCIDIGSHIISDEEWQIPGTLAGIFNILAENKVMTIELADEMRKMVAFRNLLIHEYGTIDSEKVFDILESHLRDIDEFCLRVSDYAGA